MACKCKKKACNICVYFGDIRQFSSSQKDVQKHSLTEFKVARSTSHFSLISRSQKDEVLIISIPS